MQLFGINSPFTGIIWLVHIVLVILALLDIFKSNMSTTNKVIWLLVVFFLPFIGLILYWILAKD